MSRHKDKQHIRLQSGYCLKCRRYKGKKAHLTPAKQQKAAPWGVKTILKLQYL